MDDTPLSEPEEESLAGPEGEAKLRAVSVEVFGPEWADRFAAIWSRLDELHGRDLPNEGLRERKKRLTRHRISSIATVLFVARGFDAVRVSEIAARAEVSEKTIYNYFPTKESMVFDDEDRQLEMAVRAVRERPAGQSPTAAFAGAMKRDMQDFVEVLGDDQLDFMPAFSALISQTPALRAALSEYQHRLVESLSEVLGAEMGVNPRDPEPLTAARAIAGLMELANDSHLRRIADGVSPAQLQASLEADLDRGVRLLDAGLWSKPAWGQHRLRGRGRA